MSGLFGSTPEPSGPSATQQRAEQLSLQESQRAETNRISSIQAQLAQETTFRNRGYGLRSLLGPLGSAKTSLLGSG